MAVNLLKRISVGDEIEVSQWSGGTVVGTVTLVDDDIKNGQPGVDYTDIRGDLRWCYLSQIVKVSRVAA